MSLCNVMDDKLKYATYCQGKIAFDNKAAADRIAHRSRGRHEAKLTSYKCPCCPKWHVGATMRNRGSMRKVRHHHVEDL